jgi:hypothetical protein
MGEVIEGKFESNGEYTSKEVLETAMKYELESVIVVGRNKDGKLFLSSTTLDASLMVFDLEVAKNRVIVMSDYDGEEE